MSDMPTEEEIGNGIPYEPNFSPYEDTRGVNRERPRASSEDPTDTIDKTEEIQILKFPHDLPKYNMTFAFEEYKRPSQFEGLKTDGAKGYIALPIPQEIADISRLSYEEKAPGIIVEGLNTAIVQAGGGYDGMVDAFSAKNAGKTIKTGLNTLTGSGLRGIITGAKKIGSKLPLIGSNASDIIDGALQVAGLADNPFATVAFTGPQFKSHSFSWLLSPKIKEESDTIKAITDTFKKVAHPELLKLKYGGFYRYPSIVIPKFHPDKARQYLYEFKPCVITSVAIQPFAQTDRPGFYHTTQAPNQVRISIELREIELWRNGDGSDYTINDGDFNDIIDPTTLNLGNIDAG